jgi:hypothetical protein
MAVPHTLSHENLLVYSHRTDKFYSPSVDELGRYFIEPLIPENPDDEVKMYDFELFIDGEATGKMVSVRVQPFDPERTVKCIFVVMQWGEVYTPVTHSEIDSLVAPFTGGTGTVPPSTSKGHKFLIFSDLAYFYNKIKSVFVAKEPGKTLTSNDLTDEMIERYEIGHLHSKQPHAPVNAQANVLERVSVNGAVLPINTAKGVDIDLTAYSKNDDWEPITIAEIDAMFL